MIISFKISTLNRDVMADLITRNNFCVFISRNIYYTLCDPKHLYYYIHTYYIHTYYIYTLTYTYIYICIILIFGTWHFYSRCATTNTLYVQFILTKERHAEYELVYERDSFLEWEGSHLTGERSNICLQFEHGQASPSIQ